MAVYDGDDDRRPFLSSPSKARHGSRDANKADADADATREAFFISVISVLCTSVSSLVGLGLFFNAGSTAMLGFALVNIVDTIGSLLMLWRFEGGGDAVPHAVLEARGSDDRPTEIRILISTGLSTCATSSAIGLYKLTVAERTDSDALYMDGVCSLNGALLSFSAAAAAILFKCVPRFWWSDLVVSCACALWLIFYGAAVLSRFKRRRWWSPAFWAVEADDGARAGTAVAPGEFYPGPSTPDSVDRKTRGPHCREGAWS
ncbi:ribulose-phosphate 3-epimerase [Aureococcus anophagefferens]|nr:ribulose-phosphate 3-epimerase [Aureococcus anophagefferens]